MKVRVMVLAAFLLVSNAVRANSDLAESIAFLRHEARAHRMVLLGEKHGTREIPRLMAALVAAEAAERPVLLALEVHRSEQSTLDRYLASDGKEADRVALHAGAFWQVQNDQHDGRRSRDMLALIGHLRELRQAGRDVRLLAYDLDPSKPRGDHHARDREMAATLRRAYDANPEARLLVLTGNVHAMLARPDYAPAEMQQPMGSYLRDLDPFAVNITASTGEFWACRDGRCGPQAEFPAPRPSERLDGEVYHLQLVLPNFTVAKVF